MMSVQLTNALLSLGPHVDLSSMERLVLLAVCFRADNFGICQASRAEIARQLNLERPNAHRYFASLEKRGLLEFKKRIAIRVNLEELQKIFEGAGFTIQVIPQITSSYPGDNKASEGKVISEITRSYLTDNTFSLPPYNPLSSKTKTISPLPPKGHTRETFFDAYPKGTKDQAKAKALLAEALKREGVGEDVMVEAVKRAMRSKRWQENDGQYVPSLENWLKGDCHEWVKRTVDERRATYAAKMSEIKGRIDGIRGFCGLSDPELDAVAMDAWKLHVDGYSLDKAFGMAMAKAKDAHESHGNGLNGATLGGGATSLPPKVENGLEMA